MTPHWGHRAGTCPTGPSRGDSAVGLDGLIFSRYLTMASGSMEKAEHLALIFPNGRLSLRGKFGCSPQSLADFHRDGMGSRGVGEPRGGGGGFLGSASHWACLLRPRATQQGPTGSPAFLGASVTSCAADGAGVLQTVGVQLAQLALGAPCPPCSTVRRLKGLVRVPPP